MRQIGIKELRRHTGRYLREVETGETIEVTDRGRPVARLVPVRQGSHVEDLVASGRLAPASGDALGLGPPLPAVKGKPLPSEALAAARADEA